MTASVWKKTILLPALVGVMAFGFASDASAVILLEDPNLPGNTQADYWSNARLSSTESAGYGSFPGLAAWPSAIESSTPNSGTDGDAGLAKLGNGAGGGPYAAGGAIYHGGGGTTPNTLGGSLGIQDGTALADVKNVVLQIQIGEAFGHDFYNGVLPVLNYNGGAQSLAATNTFQIGHEFAGTFPNPEGGPDLDLFTNTYLLQWDVTGLGITSLSLTFSGVQHSLLYQLRLDQSDVFVNVPEPSTSVLAALAMAGVVGLVWKKRRTA